MDSDYMTTVLADDDDDDDRQSRKTLVNSSMGRSTLVKKTQVEAHLEMRRSCAMLGRTRSLLATSRQRNARLVIPTQFARTKLPRDTHPLDPSGPSSVVQIRSSSSPKSAQVDEQPPIQLDADSPPPPSEPEKPPRRTGVRRATRPLRETGNQIRTIDPSFRKDSISSGCPMIRRNPIRGESLSCSRQNYLTITNLHIALHPHTQHRAAYVTTATGPPIQPTLALYCPVEGGEYVVDETVRKLARRTGAEVERYSEALPHESLDEPA